MALRVRRAKAASADRTAPPPVPGTNQRLKSALAGTTLFTDDARLEERAEAGPEAETRIVSSASRQEPGTIQPGIPAAQSAHPQRALLSMVGLPSVRTTPTFCPAAAALGSPSTAPQLQSFPPRNLRAGAKSPSVLQVPYLRSKMTSDSASTGLGLGPGPGPLDSPYLAASSASRAGQRLDSPKTARYGGPGRRDRDRVEALSLVIFGRR